MCSAALTAFLLATCVSPTASVTTVSAPHDPEGRLEELTEQLALRPGDALLYLERGQLYHHNEDVHLALCDLDRALALDAGLTVVHLARASALLIDGRPELALESLERFLASEPAHGEARLLRATVLAELEYWPEAALAYEEALVALKTRRPQHYLDAGRAWVEAEPNQLERALATLAVGIAELGPVVSLVQLTEELERRGGTASASDARFVATMEGHVWAPGRLPANPSIGGALSVTSTLVTPGSVWRYLDDGSNQGTAWRARTFNDSSWSSGNAQLGYGDNDEMTAVSYGPDPDDKHVTTYFRHSFQVPNPGVFDSILIGLLRDDGAVVYLNGTEVARSNLRTGVITSSSFAIDSANAEAERAFYHFSADASLLRSGTNVLAVEVHQRGRKSVDLSFDLELHGATGTASVVRGPYLQLGTARGAVVRWRTDVPTSTLLWGGYLPGSLLPVYSDPVPKTEHVVSLSGLSPEKKHYYAIGDENGILAGNDASHYFETSPLPGEAAPTRVWVIGDSGAHDSWADDVRDGYLAATAGEHTDVWLMLGDNAYPSGTDSDYQTAVFDMYPTLLRNTFLWPTMGNHDAYSSSSDSQSGPYYDMFDLPGSGQAGGVPSGTEAYYSFDHGDIHFISLDSQDTDLATNGAMHAWLTADIAATNATWLIAFWHHPPYSRGSHDSDLDWDSGGRLIDMRRNFLPVLEAAGVDLVLTGHSHAYERSYLLNGHYGKSWTLKKRMVLDPGDGAEDGDGTYAKPTPRRGANQGAVYVVAGNGSTVYGGQLNHPAMSLSLNSLGSLLLEIDGEELDGTLLGTNGETLDTFTIEKGLRRTLLRYEPRVSIASGGKQELLLNAGPAYAGKPYYLAGSFDTSPGIQVGAINIPLNVDSWFNFSLRQSNSGVFQQSIGTLDDTGRAQALIDLPAIQAPNLIGLRLYHAYVVTEPGGSPILMASNPVWITLDP